LKEITFLIDEGLPTGDMNDLVDIHEEVQSSDDPGISNELQDLDPNYDAYMEANRGKAKYWAFKVLETPLELEQEGISV
jgi:hypothetical protein